MAKRVKLLAFETTSKACSVALLNETSAGMNTVSECKIQPLQQGQVILPMIQSVMEQARTGISDLDGIAYGKGPGSFTGARIAASVAQALGFATRCPLIPISSMAILAQNAYNQYGWKSLLVAIDARAGEVYWARYQMSADEIAMLQGEETVISPDAVSMPEDESKWYGIGDAWASYEKILIKSLPVTVQDKDQHLVPDAKAMLPLARLLFEQKKWVQAEAAVPSYLR